MKTYQKIKIVASVLGLLVALRCVDSLTPTSNELLAGMMLAVVSIVSLLGLQAKPEAEE